MSKKKAVIIDLDIGNIFSLRSALNFCGIDTKITSNISDLETAENIILPGDGSFHYSMKKLQSKQLISFLKDIPKTNKNFLGICVGMQLLFETSSEHKETGGLSILKGQVRPIPSTNNLNKKIEIPNIGWCPLYFKNNKGINNSIIDGVDELSKVYFIHSYRVENYDTNDEIASTNYFNHNILAMVKKNNITACQFHPEKSGEVGLKLLKNFFSLN